MSSGHLKNLLVTTCIFSGADQHSNLETISDGEVTPTNIYEAECHPKILGLFDPVSTVLPYYPPTGPLGQFSELSSDTSKLSHSTSGLPPEMINSLSVFIYPEGLYVWGSSSNLPQPTFSHIILTDIEGDRHYCVNVTFWRRFLARKCTDSNLLTYELTLASASQQRADTSVEICVPLNVTLLSRVPLFQTMKSCLSSIVQDLTNSPDMYTDLLRFTSMLFLIPSPPSGSLALHFSLNNHFIMLRGLPQDYPHCDSHLFWPFFSLTTDDILRIFGYVITQQNIVFTSNNYNLLVLTMHSFCHYLFPFEWRLTFAPLLPKRLLAILDSPTTFLCGCHTFSMKEVDLDELKNIIFVSLDKGTVTCTDDLSLDQPNLTFPSYFIQKYNQSINTLFNRRCHSLHAINEASAGNLLSEKIQRVEWEAEMDHKLIDLLMGLVSDVFQEISTYVTYPSDFNSEGFLRGIIQEFKPFYKAAIETDVFNQMLKQLLNKLKTPFTKSLDEIRKKRQFSDSTAQDLIDPMSSFICISTNERGIHTEYVSLQHSVAGNNIAISTKQSTVLSSILELPSFPDSNTNSNIDYFKSCVERINSQLRNSSSPCRAEYIFLRGYYLLALGDPLKAMEDFLSHLSKINVNLVPSEETLVEIYSRLSEECKEALRNMPYFSRSVFEMEHEISLSRRMSHAKFPIQTMTRDEFELHLQTNGISANSETCSILFSVLTNGGTIILPDTLKKFSECWSEVKKINLSLQHNSKIDFPPKEQIVFCTCDKPLSQPTQHPPQPTELVKYHNTQGQLLITEHNVWLLQLDNKLVHLFRFTHVSTFAFVETKDRHFQKLSHPFIIKIQPTTEVEDLKSVAKINLDKICRKPIYHSIRFYDSRMCVFVIECFKELHAAHALVQRRKDEAYLGEGKLNVLLLATLQRMSKHTLNRNGEHDLLSQGIKQGLLYLIKTQIVSRDIDNNYLLYRFNPLSTDTQKASIEVLLPINNRQAQNQIFWVGYVYQRESIICVYDFHSRTKVSDFILHDQRVEAIVEVGPKVWLSSLNKSIYIVDKESYTKDGRLSEPNDVAVAFHYDVLQGEVWVLYHKGQIVVWDTRSLEQKRVIQLQTKSQEPTRYSSMVIYQNYIFTQSSRSLLVYEKDLGELVSTLPLVSPKSDSPIEARSLCVSAKGQVWVAGIREPIVFVFDPIKLQLIKALDVNENTSRIQCNGFNSILSVSNNIWLGGRNGCIYIYDNDDLSLSTYFKAHEDSIRCLSVTRSQSIVTSGSNSLDGRVSFWST